MTPTYLYVSHADSGDIHALAMDPQGELTLVQQLTLGGNLMPMALGRDRRRLYIARRSDPLAVITLSIDPATGHLAKLGETALPASMAYISLDHSGRFLFAASYPGHCLTVSAIGEDGQPGAVQQTIPTNPHAHAILASPSNRHVLATSLGGGQVLQFHFDASTGQLTPNAVPFWSAKAGAGPRHLRFHPNGRWVYVLNELDATLDVLAFDKTSGTLSALQNVPTLPAGADGEPWGADLHLTPDGRFLYSCERRSSTLALFRIDATTGQLTALGHTATEIQPRGFAISPDGQQLLIVGQLSHHLSRYRIDSATGALNVEQRMPMGQNPNWITFLA
jgi:6-phosphogluconolactonase